MKRLLNISFIYFLLAMIGGIFYREFTKHLGFTGKTTLAFVHVHLLVLGTFLFLILTLFCKDTDLLRLKGFQRFLLVYNIGLPLMVIMLLVRGTVQALELHIGRGMNGMISGFSGISHILIMIGLWMLFDALKRALVLDGEAVKNKS